MVNIKEHQQSTKGTLEKVSSSRVPYQMMRKQRTSIFFGWEIIDTHTFLERTYSSLVCVCVYILRPLSLFFFLPGPPMITRRVREAGRMGFFSYIVFFSFFFRDVVVLIVKRKERYSRQLLSVTGNEKRNIGGKCVSSLLDAARVLSSSSLHTISQAEAFRKRRENWGEKKKGRKIIFGVCECVKRFGTLWPGLEQMA